MIPIHSCFNRLSKPNLCARVSPVLLAPLFTVSFVMFNSSTFASQLYSDAIQDFNLKRYHAASDEFSKVIEKEPDNADAYFYMGRSLEELKERDGAKTMYESCFKLNPFGESARQARRQLMYLADTAATSKHPTDGVKETEDTLRTIDWQTANLRAIKIVEGNRGSAWAIQSGQNAAFKKNGYFQPTTTNFISDPNAQIDLSRALSPRSVPFAVTPQVPYVNPNTYNAGPFSKNVSLPTSNLQAIDTHALRADAAVRGAHYQTEALLQATETQKAANNLKTLLAEDKDKAGPHLRALGTNLYVRNYADHDDDLIAPDDPLLQLKAKALRLADLPEGQKAIAKVFSK